MVFSQPSYFVTNAFRSIWMNQGTNVAPFPGMLLTREYALYALESIELRTNIPLYENKIKLRDELINTLTLRVTNISLQVSNLESIVQYNRDNINALAETQKANTWWVKNSIWMYPLVFFLGAAVSIGIFWVTGYGFKGFFSTKI